MTNKKENILNIYIEGENFKYEEAQGDIERILEYISTEREYSPVEMSLYFVNSERMKELNNEHRGKDSSTDVLSFPHNEIEEGYLYMGDVFINIDIIDEQAESIDSDPLTEVKFLAMHGMLHISGYDHMNEDDEEKMTAKQREIFKTLNIREW